MTPEISELVHDILFYRSVRSTKPSTEKLELWATTLQCLSERCDEAQKSHFAKVAEFVTGDDTSELGMARAERDYALHCLERELAICHQAETRLDAAVKLLDRYAPSHDDDCVVETWHGKGPLRCSCGLYDAIGAITAVPAPVSGSTEAGK